jgi:hypothetical protein
MTPFGRPFLGLACALLLPTAIAGEGFRTLVASVSTLPLTAEGIHISMGYNEAIALTFPESAPFVQGIEIELRPPRADLGLSSALVWELWRQVSPLPDESVFAYEGLRLTSQPLPDRAGFAIQIPLRGDHSLRDGPFASLIRTVVAPGQFPLVFRLYPISKGIGPELERAVFQVRVRPLFTDEGAIRLLLARPAALPEGEVTVTIDGKAQEAGQSYFVLKPGPHYLRLSSSLYREETRSFTVEQGRVLELPIELADTMPLLLLEAPDSALVSIDGVKVNHVGRPSMTVEPGEHSIVCRIGDYSLTRKFTAYRGKTYRIVLSIDLEVQEAP